MTSGNIGGDRLKAFVERIERLEEDKAALAADIKEVYAEAKADGFSIRIMKAPGARGAVGSAFDLADTKLLEAGFHRLGKNRYQAPADPQPEDAADGGEG